MTFTYIALGLMALRFAKPPARQVPAGIDRTWHGPGLAKLGGGQEPPPKKRRHAVYRTRGFTILACVVLAAVSNLLPASVKAEPKPAARDDLDEQRMITTTSS